MSFFFRRKKTEQTSASVDPASSRRLKVDDLAAAFPSAPAQFARHNAPPTTPRQDTPADQPSVTPVPTAPSAPAPAGQPSVTPVPTAPSAPAPAGQPSVTPVPAAPSAPAPAGQPSVTPVPTAPSAPAPAGQPSVTPVPTAPSAPAPAGQPSVTPVPAAPSAPAPAGQPSVTPVPAAPSSSLTASGSSPLAAPSRWRERLRNHALSRSLLGLLSSNPRLDASLLDDIETALIIADVGVTATSDVISQLDKRMQAREFANAQALYAALRQALLALLTPVAIPWNFTASITPTVILTVGVNGTGKTTTIAKLAHRWQQSGHSVMLAAGDTFRAAAVAQLQTWGQRHGIPVIAQGQHADAAAVAFDALQAAKARSTHILIIDTAGRLHTQSGLMQELAKIARVLGKVDSQAPHEVLMVIDGTTGQNAIAQLRQFHAAIPVTGLVVTKLDGTAKGGIVFALAQEFQIPIRFIGLGEQPQDLRPFDPVAFVDGLLPVTMNDSQ